MVDLDGAFVFVCGSLEPRRDGVGDYTRCLAAEIIRNGHEAKVISLFDRKVEKEIAEVQKEGSTEVEVIRIPSAFDSASRYLAAKKYIDAADPQVLSLQFVPFSFHHRGLPRSFADQLKAISGGRPWHVMFHELWVGMEVGASQKLVWWGRLQKIIIKSFLRRLGPGVIHTHASLYVEQIRRLGYSAKQLPLFSSIIPDAAPRRRRTSSVTLKLLLFGSIHPGAPLIIFLDELVEYKRLTAREIEITFVGHSGDELATWVDAFRSSGLTAEVKGELPPAEVSEILSAADVGISTTPSLLAEKSSAIAAMKAHGLPVICLRELRARGVEGAFEPFGVLTYRKGKLHELLTNLDQSGKNLSLDAITRMFLADVAVLTGNSPSAVAKAKC